MKSKMPSTTSFAIVVITLAMLAMKWLSFPDLSYWIVFTPILTLMAVFVLTLVLSIIVGSIAYVFKKDKIGERKQAKKDLEQKLKEEADKELEDWRKAYVKREQAANIETMNRADEIIEDFKNNDKGPTSDIR